MPRRPILRTLSLLALTLTVGCSDRLTAPEAMRLVDILESSRSVSARELQREFFWDVQLALFGGHKSSLLDAASQAVVQRDGHGLTYRALVLEHVRLSHSELDCLSGKRWSAILWSDDQQHWVGLRGGDFGLRLDPRLHWRGDCDRVVEGPEPYLTAAHGDTSWVAADGEGDISANRVIGACPFLTSDAEAQLCARGVTCELVGYTVRFAARLERSDYAGRLLPSEQQVRADMQLSPANIIGVRLTIACDGTERTNDFCPRKRAS